MRIFSMMIMMMVNSSISGLLVRYTTACYQWFKALMRQYPIRLRIRRWILPTQMTGSIIPNSSISDSRLHLGLLFLLLSSQSLLFFLLYLRKCFDWSCSFGLLSSTGPGHLALELLLQLLLLLVVRLDLLLNLTLPLTFLLFLLFLHLLQCR